MPPPRFDSNDPIEGLRELADYHIIHGARALFRYDSINNSLAYDILQYLTLWELVMQLSGLVL